jgi:hypothetical protein
MSVCVVTLWLIYIKVRFLTLLSNFFNFRNLAFFFLIVLTADLYMTENNRKDISCIKNSLKMCCQNGHMTIFICGLGHFFEYWNFEARKISELKFYHFLLLFQFEMWFKSKRRELKWSYHVSLCCWCGLFSRFFHNFSYIHL